MKRKLALILAVLFCVSLLGSCGSSEPAATAPENTEGAAPAGTEPDAPAKPVVVWTNNTDLEKFAGKYKEETGKDVEVLVVDGAEYSNKVNTALGSKSAEVDIIVGEPQMLLNFYEAGFLTDIGGAPYNANADVDKLVDYVRQNGTDSNGVLRALAYQATPGVIFYRRDLWQAVYGDDTPEFVESKTKDFATILDTAREVAQKGYRLIPDTGTLRRFANDEAWVVDGALVMTEKRDQYFDTAVSMFQEDLTAQCAEWSAAWYASMTGPMPINVGWEAADSEAYQNAETTEVMMYSMASWGAGIIKDTVADTETFGKYGVAKAPSAFTEGGGYVGINEYSENKDAAWDFIKYVCLTESTYEYWIEETGGDMVALKTAIEAHTNDEFELFAGQKVYPVFLEAADQIDLSTITKYDDPLKEFLGTAITSVQNGEMTKEEAMDNFYTQVRTTYPELKLPE